MENSEETIRQRKKELEIDVKDELSERDHTKEKEEKKEPPKKDFKYYFNKFRYYHYYCSEKVNNFISVVCMWIIKIQFYLMGYRINGLPSIHEIEENRLKLNDDWN